MIEYRFYKVGDTAPPLDYQATSPEGHPIDCRPYTSAFFSLRRKDCPTKKLTHVAATIVDAQSGHLRYQWVAGDLSEQGQYYGEFDLEGADGNRTVPGEWYLE